MQKQYAGYLQKWQRFCSGRKVDMLPTPVEEELHFLTELFEATVTVAIVPLILLEVHCLPLLKAFSSQDPHSLSILRSGM